MCSRISCALGKRKWKLFQTIHNTSKLAKNGEFLGRGAHLFGNPNKILECIWTQPFYVVEELDGHFEKWNAMHALVGDFFFQNVLHHFYLFLVTLEKYHMKKIRDFYKKKSTKNHRFLHQVMPSTTSIDRICKVFLSWSSHTECPLTIHSRVAKFSFRLEDKMTTPWNF